MREKNLAEYIIEIIKSEMEKQKGDFEYRDPVVGFADANDPLYDNLTDIVGNPLLHPTDILPSAHTVIVFFLPFGEKMLNGLRDGKPIQQKWSQYYTKTNLLLDQISRRLKLELEKIGVAARSEAATGNYDPIHLTAKWGHKSSAVIAGIGTFGLNHLIITKSGTAGRMSSLVIDAKIEPTPRPTSSYCLYYKNGTCKVCLEKCPSGALKSNGEIDKVRCNAYLDGKCADDLEQGCCMCSIGPCMLKGFD